MRVVKLLAVAVIVIAASSGVAFAAATGNSCAEAVGVLSGTISGDVSSGARWYSFESPVAGNVPINTSLPGTNFQTRLTIYGSCGGNPIVTAESDDQRKAWAVVGSFPGQNLFIEVSKMSGAGNSFDLAVNDAPEGGCGNPAAGDCFSANGSPFCADTCSADPCPGCCDTVCAADPFCCSNTWDGLCADGAMALCVVIPVELQSFDLDG